MTPAGTVRALHSCPAPISATVTRNSKRLQLCHLHCDSTALLLLLFPQAFVRAGAAVGDAAREDAPAGCSTRFAAASEQQQQQQRGPEQEFGLPGRGQLDLIKAEAAPTRTSSRALSEGGLLATSTSLRQRTHADNDAEHNWPQVCVCEGACNADPPVAASCAVGACTHLPMTLPRSTQTVTSLP
jgi:hypothetical protein